MLRRALLSAALLAATAFPAFAQQPQMVRIRGTVEALDGHMLKVKSRTGEDMTIKLADNVSVVGLKKLEMSEIKANSYIGTAARNGRDGKMVAIEVLVFPESMRGAGEGHRPWDLEPDSTMTNATVSTVMAAPQGREMQLSYEGGAKTVVVPEGVPIVTFVPGDMSLLAPGKQVMIGATRMPDGTLTAARVTAEKDGVVPPM